MEQAEVLLLGGDGAVLDQLHFMGSEDRVDFPLRQVILRALQCNCQGLMLRHNHPSGNSRPSKADIEITRLLSQMLCPLGIRLIDHVIESTNDSFSFRENGLL
ncbi:MAG: JAB domain-containing protein [Sphingobium sp.]